VEHQIQNSSNPQDFRDTLLTFTANVSCISCLNLLNFTEEFSTIMYNNKI